MDSLPKELVAEIFSYIGDIDLTERLGLRYASEYINKLGLYTPTRAVMKRSCPALLWYYNNTDNETFLECIRLIMKHNHLHMLQYLSKFVILKDIILDDHTLLDLAVIRGFSITVEWLLSENCVPKKDVMRISYNNNDIRTFTVLYYKLPAQYHCCICYMYINPFRYIVDDCRCKYILHCNK